MSTTDLVVALKRFRVVHSPYVHVRKDPDVTSESLGFKRVGDIVTSSSEVNGWLQLANEDGWMLRSGDSIGSDSLVELADEIEDVSRCGASELNAGSNTDQIQMSNASKEMVSPDQDLELVDIGAPELDLASRTDHAQSSNTDFASQQIDSRNQDLQSVDEALVNIGKRYRVVGSPFVYVREYHNVASALLGYKRCGDVVLSSCEVHDWIKLANEDGWMLRDGQSLGFGLLLEPIAERHAGVGTDTDVTEAVDVHGTDPGISSCSAKLKEVSSLETTLATCEQQLSEFEAEVNHLSPKAKEERLPSYRELAKRFEAVSAKALEMGCAQNSGGAVDVFEQSTLAIERIASLINANLLLQEVPLANDPVDARNDKQACIELQQNDQKTTKKPKTNQLDLDGSSSQMLVDSAQTENLNASSRSSDHHGSAGSVSRCSSFCELLHSVDCSCCSGSCCRKKPLKISPDAAKAWIKANASDTCTVLEIATSASNYSYFNGQYDCQRTRSQGEAPIFKRQTGTLECDWWLYYASDERWHIGRSHELSHLKPTRRTRSAQCKFGVLPHAVTGWQRFTAIGWVSTSMRVHASKRSDMRKKWKEADAMTLCWNVEFSGDRRRFYSVNGAFDLQPALLIDEVPLFKKRRADSWETQLWLYFARDSRWHVGRTRDKNERRVGRILRSDICKPGTLPTAATGWECLSLSGGHIAWLALKLCDCTRMPDIQMRYICECPGGMAIPCDVPSCIGWTPSQIKVAAANRTAYEGAWKKSDNAKTPIEINLASSRCCCMPWSGTFDAQAMRFNREPVFRRRSRRCGIQLWLYFAHNRWYVGGSRAKNQSRGSFLIRSKECKPGTFPGEVEGWESFKACMWCSTHVSVTSKAHDAAAAEKAKLATMQGCLGQAFSAVRRFCPLPNILCSLAAKEDGPDKSGHVS